MNEDKPVRKITHNIYPNSVATFFVGSKHKIPDPSGGVANVEVVRIAYNHEHAEAFHETRHDVFVAYGGQVQIWKAIMPTRVLEYELFDKVE